jgi:predicted ATPase
VVIADNDIEHGHERFKNAFHTLTRVLCSQFPPMIFMVLDDLQWADVSSSLEVIDFLISDIQNPNPLMIIGSYRSSEQVDENSIIFNKIASNP